MPIPKPASTQGGFSSPQIAIALPAAMVRRGIGRLRNHAPDIAAMDLFVVPTVGFDLLYAIVIVRLARRDLVWINVTANPTAEWIARQITEAFPWDETPRYLTGRDAHLQNCL
jgi:hypothetical protein